MNPIATNKKFLLNFNYYRCMDAIYTNNIGYVTNHIATYTMLIISWVDLRKTFRGASLIKNACGWCKSVENLHI